MKKINNSIDLDVKNMINCIGVTLKGTYLD